MPPRWSKGSRLLRAALLVLALLWVPASAVLAAVGVLRWVSVLFALLTLAAVIVWLRTEAAGHRAAPSSSDELPARRDPGIDDTQTIDTSRHAIPSSATRTDDGLAPAAAAAAAGRAASVFDVEQVDEPGAGSTAGDATVADVERPAAGTWSPVPVPRPTYALKGRSEPRLTPNGIPADVFATPEFADEADELDERALFARRAASG